MRILLVLTCLLWAGAAPALETARELAAAGAPRLALARIAERQPGERAAPGWADWEVLRLELLVELGRNDEAIKRAEMLPDNLPPAALKACLLFAGRAAVRVGNGALARAYSARVLWRLGPDAAEIRAARLIVIDSHVAERRGESAFRAMLRFEQDYRPLEPALASHFAQALLDLGLDREAVNWLAGLEDASALKLRVQLRAALVTPEAAIAQARGQLARRGKPAGGEAGYWLVVAEAAARKGDGVQRAEALENLLNRADTGAQAPALWQAYLAHAQAAANRNQLLAGDDKAWANLATRRQGVNAIEPRALLAWLARNARDAEVRRGAPLQLVVSLQKGGLDFSALHLFAGAEISADALDAGARYLLGEIAEKRGQPALAARFWQGLPPPEGTGREEWQLRQAEALWRAGAFDAALGTVRELARTTGTLPGAAAGRMLSFAREIAAAGTPAAEGVLAALLPMARREDSRVLLHALGAVAESSAHHARAADYFLRAALADTARATDAQALQSRLAAGINLARAGYREDARAQFQWLIRHSKDPSQLEIARRELARP